MSSSDSPPKEKRRSWIYILLVLLLVCGCVALVAGPGRPLVLGFLSGGNNATETPTSPPPVTSSPPPVICGDGKCDPNAKEDCTTCPKDCGQCLSTPPICGDGVCNKDAGEDCKTCEKDCGVCPPGNTRGACLDPCDPANPTCEAGLECAPKATGSKQYICWNQKICVPTPVPTCNNNGVCEAGEVASCPDCKPCVCGDGVCEQARCNELQQNCPADCGNGQTCVCTCSYSPTAGNVCTNSCTGAKCSP